MDYTKLFSSSSQKMKSSKIRELMKYASMPGVISLAGGMPDPDNFPFSEIKGIINQWDTARSKAALQYGSTQGYTPLIEKLKKRMTEKKKINMNGQEMLITTGGQQAISLIAKVFVDPGDVILVEDPSFIGAMAAFLAQGAQMESVRLEKDGVDLEQLEENIIKLRNNGKNPKFFYTIPTFQNPAGVTLSVEKRKKLYELAKRLELVVLEDDPYSDLYFTADDRDYQPVKSFGNDAPVIYLGTFSKILSPGFRMGWVCADPLVIDKVALAKQSADACSSSFGQVVADDYLQSGAIDHYLEKMRRIYRTKRDRMVEGITRYFPKDIDYSKPEGGFFLYVRLPEGISAEKLFHQTMEKKVAFVTGDPFHLDPVIGDQHIRLSFSNSTFEEIDRGTEVIGEAINRMQKK